MNKEYDKKLNAALGLISIAKHRVLKAVEESYDELIDASNILVSLKGKRIEKTKKSGDKK